jgi:hypothetical protein
MAQPNDPVARLGNPLAEHAIAERDTAGQDIVGS